MNDYRYILEPYSGRNSRFTCPNCEKSHQFTRYIDTETGEAIARNVGKCNRIDKCGYHYTPKQFFNDNNLNPTATKRENLLPFSRGDAVGRGVIPNYINNITFQKSLRAYEKNNFVSYLHTLFDDETVNQLIKDYNIGTSSRWNGGTTIFWQLDIKGRVRTGKLIKFDAEGHRMKYKNHWVHSIFHPDNFILKQCFFGEHLLTRFSGKTVAIVESEKTAIIASMYLPELLWLASGGANGINSEKVKVLRGREVILFPDTSATGDIFDSWNEIAKKYGFICSDFIEKNATPDDRKNGLDIADYFISPLARGDADLSAGASAKVEGRGVIALTKPEKLLNSFISKYPTIQTFINDLNLVLVNNGSGQSPSRPIASVAPTPQIPYNSPSPAAIIDSKIDTNKIITDQDLLVKSRTFKTTSGDEIELIGIRNYGFCRNWESHKKQEGYCRACILNCLHTIKINGKLQVREYSQLEVLIMQGTI